MGKETTFEPSWAALVSRVNTSSVCFVRMGVGSAAPLSTSLSCLNIQVLTMALADVIDEAQDKFWKGELQPAWPKPLSGSHELQEEELLHFLLPSAHKLAAC